MISQTEINIPAHHRGCHLITELIVGQLPQLPERGLLHLHILHTSAALTLNENYDPDVRHDLDAILDHIVPERQHYFTHTLEGDDDMPAHAKAALIGPSLTIPISRHRLRLGTWQGIYLCEFRNNGGPRRVVATIIGE
ncbi:MAG: YjbQ family protein [Muribaculaceae bacterium]|nr:YjbQ family protein [Muribaculaceae bacterium]MBQ7212135.1 YjbQ family protein [Muribaculaceae bacterium]